MRAQKLIRALEATGLTQSDIARRTRISQPTISRIATGRHQDPRYSTVMRLEELCRNCGVDLTKLELPATG